MVRFGHPKQDNQKKKTKEIKHKKKHLELNEVLGQPVSIKKFEVSSFAEIPIFIIKIYVKIQKVLEHKSYKGPQSDKLFNEYAQHLKKMITDSQNRKKPINYYKRYI